MEQARFFIPTRSKKTLISSLEDDSWEEQAFAEDACGNLGGCIWPPRSYSCTFCRREFRSAQALGGHMNVHRRDRARLKHSPNTHDEINHVDHEIKSHNPIGSHQFCTLVYNPNPNFNSRVSSSNKQEDCCDTSSIPPSFTIDHKQNHGSNRYNHFFDLESEREKNPRILELGFNSKKDYVKADLSVSLNLVIRGSPPLDLSDVSCKRRRTETSYSSSSSSLIKTNSVDHHHHVQSKVLEHNPSSIIEEIDLELRLGRNSK